MTPTFVRTHWLGTCCNMDSSSVGARWQDETSTKHNWLTNAHDDNIASSLQRHRHGPQTEIWRHPQNRKYTYTPYHYADKGGPSHGHWQHAQKLVKIWRVVLEICSWRDRQTDRQTRTSLSYWGRVINVYMYVHSAVQQVCRCFHSHSAAEGCRTDSLRHIANSRRHWTRLLEAASVTAEHLELRSAWINVPAITCCSSSQIKWMIGQLQNTAILKKTNVKQVVIKSLKVIINFIPVSLSMYI